MSGEGRNSPLWTPELAAKRIEVRGVNGLGPRCHCGNPSALHVCVGPSALPENGGEHYYACVHCVLGVARVNFPRYIHAENELAAVRKAAVKLVNDIDRNYGNGSLRMASTDVFWDTVDSLREALGHAPQNASEGMPRPSEHPETGVRRAGCPCGEPNPPELGPCTPEAPCGYAKGRIEDLWIEWPSGGKQTQ